MSLSTPILGAVRNKAVTFPWAKGKTNSVDIFAEAAKAGPLKHLMKHIRDIEIVDAGGAKHTRDIFEMRLPGNRRAVYRFDDGQFVGKTVL